MPIPVSTLRKNISDLKSLKIISKETCALIALIGDLITEGKIVFLSKDNVEKKTDLAFPILHYSERTETLFVNGPEIYNKTATELVEYIVDNIKEKYDNEKINSYKEEELSIR
jgi:hypothetical protein